MKQKLTKLIQTTTISASFILSTKHLLSSPPFFVILATCCWQNLQLSCLKKKTTILRFSQSSCILTVSPSGVFRVNSTEPGVREGSSVWERDALWVVILVLNPNLYIAFFVSFAKIGSDFCYLLAQSV